MKPGDTFRDRSAFIPWHLWVVVAVLEDGSCLAFNVSHYRDGCDTACVVDVGDHEYIKKKSFVFYRVGEWFPLSRIEKDLQDRICFAEAPVSAALLDRIRKGVLVSAHTTYRQRETIAALGVTSVEVQKKKPTTRAPRA